MVSLVENLRLSVPASVKLVSFQQSFLVSFFFSRREKKEDDADTSFGLSAQAFAKTTQTQGSVLILG